MKIGMVCPYSFDVPGGVQAHVAELAAVLIERGHRVSVLAPASPATAVPPYVTRAGRGMAVRYNGSVARLSFGPLVFARVREWLADNDFDVIHVHEPSAPSLALLVLTAADGPIVATFHTMAAKSLALKIFQGMLRPLHERITARVAVSEEARHWQRAATGADSVEIPNGVHLSAFQQAHPLPGYPRTGKTIAFVGRYDEPRKGMAILLAALPRLVRSHPDLQILVVGPGDSRKLRAAAGQYAHHLRLLGQAPDVVKAAALRSADVYCAPHLGGESFGVVLVEAMAAGTAVVASELAAFRRVLGGGAAGVLVPPGDAGALAAALEAVLTDPVRRARLAAAGADAVVGYDWAVVAEQILRVYETVTVGVVPERTTR